MRGARESKLKDRAVLSLATRLTGEESRETWAKCIRSRFDKADGLTDLISLKLHLGHCEGGGDGEGKKDSVMV